MPRSEAKVVCHGRYVVFQMADVAVPTLSGEWSFAFPPPALPASAVLQLLCHPRGPGLFLAGVRLVIAGYASGLHVLRTLSLGECCRHYPCAAAVRLAG